MSKYSIHQWNQTIDSSNTLRPIFTFDPDADFLMYLQDNPGQPILLFIDGTDYYDGQQFGTCISSADFPTFGPNYARVNKDTYVMVLHTQFSLYPRTPGSMTILYDVRSPALSPCAYKTMSTESYTAPTHSDVVATTVTEDDHPTDKGGRVDMRSYIIVGSIILVLLILIFAWVYKCYVV